MNRKRGKYIPVIIIIALIVLVYSIVANSSEKSTGKSPVQQTTALLEEKEKYDYDQKFIGVIKKVNLEKQSITFYDIDNNNEIVLFYRGVTDIMDKYDQKLAPAQLKLGEIVDVYYKADKDLIAVNLLKDSWEYKKINHLKIDREDRMITVGDQNYQYSDTIFVTDMDKEIGLIDIHEKDEITIKGIGSKVYSVIVTKGHGYIRFKNYTDFLGGNLEIGVNNSLQVVKDMLVVTREGDYRLTMENGELVGSKMVHINRDEEIIVDMGEFRKKPEESGKVTFTVLPEDAQLFLNGKEIDHFQPVQLKYDTYSLRVTAQGFEEYLGRIEINESSMQFYIVLVKKEESEESTVPDTETDQETNTQPDTNEKEESEESLKDEVNNNGTKNNYVDTEHKMYIQSPVGAKAFLNGKEIGEVPLAATKEIGNFTVSFRKEGYQSISYPVIIADDKQDVYLNFPDLMDKVGD